MALTFRWDPAKADQNRRKHGVTFEEAATVFSDPLSLTVPDPDHGEDEQRFVTIGMSAAGRTLVVIHADAGDTMRIINQRAAADSPRAATL